MQGVNLRRHWISFASLFLFAGCHSATDAGMGLVLTMTTDRVSLGTGEIAHLSLTLTNQSPRTVRIPTPVCPHYFRVNDAADRPAGPPQLACVADLRAPTDLAPGQSITLQDSWAADSGRATAPRLRVDPGRYTVQGVVAGPERQIASNAIEIEVHAP